MRRGSNQHRRSPRIRRSYLLSGYSVERLERRDLLSATAGSLDPTFGNQGIVTTDVPGMAGSWASVVAVQNDGDIVVAGGSEANGNAQSQFTVARYTAGGALDATFGSGGVVTTPFTNDYAGNATTMLIQADGKILVGGFWETSDQSDSGPAFVRYNSDGSLDTSFGVQGIDLLPGQYDSNGVLGAISTLPNGDFLVSDKAGSLYEISPSGSVDSFLPLYQIGSYLPIEFDGSQQWIAIEGFRDAAVQPDGKILVAAEAWIGQQELPDYYFTVLRLNADGSLDTTFADGGIAVEQIPQAADGAYAVTPMVQPDGTILVAGQTTQGVMVKLNADGSLDTAFGQDGIARGGPLGNYHAVAEPDGKTLMVAGTIGSLGLVQFDSDGSLDTGFGAGGSVITRVTNAGELDLTGGSTAYAEPASALQSDGDIVVAGGLVQTGAPLVDGYYQESILLARYGNDINSPSLTANGVGTLVATEGQRLTTTLATFTDPSGTGSPADYSASIDWGDGTSGAGTISGPDASGVFTVTGVHSYAEENLAGNTVGVAISASDTAEARVTDTIDVADAPLPVTGESLSAQANSPLSATLATFTDTGGAEALGDYSATVNWGDGSSPSAAKISGPDANGVFTVSGTHTYAMGGTATAEITIDHDALLPDVTVADPVTIISRASPTLTVLAGAPVVVGTGVPLSATAALSGGDEETGTLTFYLFAPGVTPAPNSTNPTNYVYSDTVNVNGDGTYDSFTGSMVGSALPTAAGGYQWVASYSGDSNNYPAGPTPAAVQTAVGPGATVVGTSLYLVGGASNQSNRVNITPLGTSVGSTGFVVQGTLNGTNIDTDYSQALDTIRFFSVGGNEQIDMAPSLTVAAVVTAGDGNDQIQLGDGNNVVVLGGGNDHVVVGNGNNQITAGSGNDHVQARGGNNTITLGDGNDQVTVGDGNNQIQLGNGNDQVQAGGGNNVIVVGSGNDKIQAGSRDNLIVDGGGHDNVQVGNGNNILIDGHVQLTQQGDALARVLGDWMSDLQAGDTAATIASLIAPRLAVTYNTTNANNLAAGKGLDWFWAIYPRDHIDGKGSDMLN